MNEVKNDGPADLSAVVRLARETTEIWADEDRYSWGGGDGFETERRRGNSWDIVDRPNKTHVLTTFGDRFGELARHIVDLLNSIERWREVNAVDMAAEKGLSWGGEPTLEQWRAMTDREKWEEATSIFRDIVPAAESITRASELFSLKDGPWSAKKRLGMRARLFYEGELAAELLDARLAAPLAELLNASGAQRSRR